MLESNLRNITKIVKKIIDACQNTGNKRQIQTDLNKIFQKITNEIKTIMQRKGK